MSAAHATRRADVQIAARLLADANLFASLPDATRDELASECRLRRLDAGQRIFTRGDAGSGMFVIAQGAVALSVATPDGDEVIFDVLRPPATFGELSVIDNRARIATATAHQTSLLAYVPAAAIHRLLCTDAGFALTMLSALAQLVRQIDDRLADRTLLDLRTRVIKYLIRAAGLVEGGPDAPVEVRVEVPVSQTDLARLVGGSRQQVNRIIVDLERCGAIRRTGSAIIAVAPRAILEGRARW